MSLCRLALFCRFAPLQPEKPRARLRDAAGEFMLVGAAQAGECAKRPHEGGLEFACGVWRVELPGGVGFEQKPVGGHLSRVLAPAARGEHPVVDGDAATESAKPQKIIGRSGKPVKYLSLIHI